jgi:hypothetical protein
VLDPTISLAFSLHTNPGAYALLLGSGISRSAEIPTGWEVVVALIERVAALSGADTAGDPAGWYREQFGREPDYSVLLEELAAEPGERQQLLREYFEPDEEDREQGRKMPTRDWRSATQLAGAERVAVLEEKMRWPCAGSFELGAAEDDRREAVGVVALADKRDAHTGLLELLPAVVVEDAPPVHIGNAHRVALTPCSRYASPGKRHRPPARY